jgi:hypothetical protein
MRYLAYFVALAVSYWVMTLADQQKESLTEKVGKALSWLMLALLLIGPICKGVHQWIQCRNGANPACSMSGHGDWNGAWCHKDGDKKDCPKMKDGDKDDDDDDAKDAGK